MSFFKRYIVYHNASLIFMVLIVALFVSSSPYPYKVDGVKLNFLLLGFHLAAFTLPFTIYLLYILFFSFIMDLLSGAPYGFYVLLYTLSLVIVVYFIKKNIHQISFTVFLLYLLVTGILKILFESLLLLNIYESSYVHQYLLKVGIKEFFINVIASIIIFFFIFITKQIASLLYTLLVKLKQL